MTLRHWSYVILKVCNRLLSILDYSIGMEPGSFLNQHVDTCSCTTAFFVLPTVHCTSPVAFGARFNAGKPVLKAGAFGIGPEVIRGVA
eukprot:2638754-Prorocentrum_lima.AAC.1